MFTQKKALEIAKNFVSQVIGKEIQHIYFKEEIKQSQKIIIAVEDFPDFYEVIISTSIDSIRLIKIGEEFHSSDFLEKPTLLSKLIEGETFRFQGSPQVWEYNKPAHGYKQDWIGITRYGEDKIICARDQFVFPCYRYPNHMSPDPERLRKSKKPR